jgi:hypothetical protein
MSSTRKIAKWRERIARYLKTAIDKPGIASWRSGLSDGSYLLGITVEGSEIHLDFFLVTSPRVRDTRPEPRADYFTFDHDGTFSWCTAAYELIHQGALEGPVGRITRRLTWWQSLRFQPVI